MIPPLQLTITNQPLRRCSRPLRSRRTTGLKDRLFARGLLLRLSNQHRAKRDDDVVASQEATGPIDTRSAHTQSSRGLIPPPPGAPCAVLDLETLLQRVLAVLLQAPKRAATCGFKTRAIRKLRDFNLLILFVLIITIYSIRRLQFVKKGSSPRPQQVGAHSPPPRRHQGAAGAWGLRRRSQAS